MLRVALRDRQSSESDAGSEPGTLSREQGGGIRDRRSRGVKGNRASIKASLSGTTLAERYDPRRDKIQLGSGRERKA